MLIENINTEVLVIGTGAGGAVTGALLAENGFDVLMVEEGPKMEIEDFTDSFTGMVGSLYRGGGLTPILGKPNVALAEGRCVGGGTVINSGLYHRAPEDILAKWQCQFDIKELSFEKLLPYFERIEKDISVSYGSTNPGSEILKNGAEKLGWKGLYVPRAQKDCSELNRCFIGCPSGAKKSMLVSYIPRALNVGAKLISGYKVVRIVKKGEICLGALAVNIDSKSTPQHKLINAEHIFVCGGAIQTPGLFVRSGIKKNIGRSFHFHPTIKVAAKFKQELNLHKKTIPTYQVKEFSPDISMGGAVFSPSIIALIIQNIQNNSHDLMKHWKHMALYYATTCSSGNGYVRKFPIINSSIFAKYFFTKKDIKNLSIGVARLSKLLLIAGAEEVYPDIQGHPPLRTIEECRKYLESFIPVKKANLHAVHIFGSCPMGEAEEKCAVNSFGRVFGYKNLYANDSSILPGSTGVNPQGTIMAIAMRNVKHFIANRKGC